MLLVNNRKTTSLVQPMLLKAWVIVIALMMALEHGTYTIKETVTPEGYKLLIFAALVL